MNSGHSIEERGYAILGVIFILTLGLIVSAGVLDSASTNTKTRALVNTRSDYFYEVEETLNKTVAWLQVNSKNILDAFTSENFDTNFDLGAPALGSNEGEFFGVPTMVKMNGTTSSVLLSNNSFFGTAAFPITENVDTGAPFNAVSEFQNADLGEANARLILIWARQTSGNYEPIFRVDVVTGNNPDRGVHSFSYIYSTLVGGTPAMGFYGRDTLDLETPNNDCSSYHYEYTGGSWSKGAPRSNCPIGGDNSLSVKSKVNGTAATLLDAGISLLPPGGDISGSTCEGAACHTYALPGFNTWDVYCPGNTTDLDINADTTLAAGGCYRNITISNNQTLTLSDIANPYYIKFIDFGGNFAKLSFGTIPLGEKVTLYVEKLNNNDHINGNKVINGNNAPHQVVINYIGTTMLSLDGTAEISGIINSPFAPVDVRGNFNYYGAIRATTLTVGGDTRINYDEGEGVVLPPTDINFSLKKASQYYR